jgi:hypothetical protein
MNMRSEVGEVRLGMRPLGAVAPSALARHPCGQPVAPPPSVKLQNRRARRERGTLLTFRGDRDRRQSEAVGARAR